MDPTSVTVAIPVSDLARARGWYDAVLDRQPDLKPAPTAISSPATRYRVPAAPAPEPG